MDIITIHDRYVTQRGAINLRPQLSSSPPCRKLSETRRVTDVTQRDRRLLSQRVCKRLSTTYLDSPPVLYYTYSATSPFLLQNVSLGRQG